MQPAKRRKNRRHDLVRPARVGPPTDAPVGSEEKQDEQSRRYDRRQAMHSPGDRVEPAGQALGLYTLAAHIAGRIDGADVERVRRDNLRIRAKSFSEKTETKVDTPQPSTPGARILQMRTRQGVGLRALARAAGISTRALACYESQVQTPGLWVLYRVAQSLRADLDYLACVERKGSIVRTSCG